MGRGPCSAVVLACVVAALRACSAPGACAGAVDRGAVQPRRPHLRRRRARRRSASRPASTAETVARRVGTRDVTDAFADAADGRFEGVRHAARGRPERAARPAPPGRAAATITITNHPIGGPVFSGPQIQPWLCQPGAVDKQCNQPAPLPLRLHARRLDRPAGAPGRAWRQHELLPAVHRRTRRSPGTSRRPRPTTA